MIKVLLVVCNNEFNGTERYVIDLARNLPPDKFDVYIATPMKGKLSDIISEYNLKEVVYDNGKTIYYSLKGLRNLYRIIRSLKIDVVHANAKSHPCLIGKLAGAKFNVETKHGIFYSKKQLENLRVFRKLYEYAKQFFVDKFIATSENDKATLMKYFRIKESKIDIVYLGIDLDTMKSISDKLHTLKNNQNRSDFVIGHIGRLTFQKAQEYLLEAFRKLKLEINNVKLVIVGTGENEEKLKKFINANELQNDVIFKGYIKNIYEELMGFDVHVLTSRYEGTGYVNLEAMALGVPIVASDVGGINNFTRNGFDAMLTIPEDPDSTYSAIKKLITDRKLRDSLILNASETVKKYTAARMAKKTAEFYIRNL